MVSRLQVAIRTGAVRNTTISMQSLVILGRDAKPQIILDFSFAHIAFRAVGPNGSISQHATNADGWPDQWTITTLPVPHSDSYPGNLFINFGDGTLHCVTTGIDSAGVPGGIYHHIRQSDGTWTFGELVLSGSTGANPQIGVSINGPVSVMWQGYSGERIYRVI
ncbi:MAG: hypothetical protein IPP40_15355 [bacterium]|nr:hypothetical protein [bacterium]